MDFIDKVKLEIKWILTINGGALLLFIGIFDKFIIDGELTFKWFYIFGMIMLFLSVTILFACHGMFLKILVNSQIVFQKLKSVEIRDPEAFDEIRIEAEKIGSSIPSEKLALIGEVLFLFGVINQALYVLIFFICKL